MDYSSLLIFHSYYRWVVLLIMLIQGIWLYLNKQNKVLFERKHFYLLLLFTSVYNIQFVLGIILYVDSPIVKSFWNNIGIGLKNRQVRFFGLEHITMMSLAIILMNVFTLRVNTIAKSDAFRVLWKRYVWLFLMILSSIPWSFSPLTSRPSFR